MSHDKISQRIMFMNLHERYVFDALQRLPQNYLVSSESRFIRFEDGNKNIFKYEPDFEIKSEDGHVLMIEVKSEHSMSLSNMVRFVEIDKAIRKNPATGFMVLVWGAQHPSSKFVARPEFKHLHISHVKDSRSVVQAIENGFAELLRPA